MSGGLAPSKSTVYVSNLPFTLTNNDIHKMFEKYGKVAKVTIVKDKVTRRSKGVAFVLFIKREDAYQSVKAINGKELFGRKWKCSIAVDNGRASDFIKRKTYPDKSKCYECGEEGHLSYKCPKNSLGDREPPPKKQKKQQKQDQEKEDERDDVESEEEQGEDPYLDTLSAAINHQRALVEQEEYRSMVASGSYDNNDDGKPKKDKKLKIKKSGYFSDEEELSD
ncbi:zinc finger CCHC-type and RNA-binding motif-containing protein 1-like [Apostichopus japonicus]|uniref:zinc finger CCHC-type and RNA-binding motif-containing protein 1-like n=1 Tax=Stichopus japonicus TaxID=307972 RepID=UPI003AB4BEF9